MQFKEFVQEKINKKVRKGDILGAITYLKNKKNLIGKSNFTKEFYEKTMKDLELASQIW